MIKYKKFYILLYNLISSSIFKFKILFDLLEEFIFSRDKHVSFKIIHITADNMSDIEDMRN